MLSALIRMKLGRGTAGQSSLPVMGMAMRFLNGNRRGMMPR